MDVTGVIGIVANLLGTVLRIPRQRVALRADTYERVLMSIGGEPDSTVYTRRGVIFVYNGGPGRVTVNGAGWEAKDGTLTEADVPWNDKTLEPGGPELEATGDPAELIRCHEAHGGLVRMFVNLAGDEKPRRRKLPDGWITKLRTIGAADRG